jgi:hypothetical protein
MGNMDRWEVALLVVVAYVAILVLVRLMTWHRDQLLDRLRRDMEREKKIRKVSEAATRQRQAG